MNSYNPDHPLLPRRISTALLIIDIQTGFLKAIPDFSEIAARSVTAVKGCKLLSVPVIATEQYPKGLGRTEEHLGAELSGYASIFEKSSFSSLAEPAVFEKLSSLGTETVIIAGMETHICVYQTVMDLLAHSFRVQLMTDAISSRNAQDKHTAFLALQQAGAVLTTLETFLFSVLRTSKAIEFKQIQALIK